MSKRTRGGADQEIFESFAALLRQSASRAMERLKLQRARSNRGDYSHGGFMPGPPTGVPGGFGGVGSSSSSSLPLASSSLSVSVKPIDILVIQFVMYYLNLQAIPANHYVRLSQEAITASPDRVLQPRYFAKANLPQLCESLVLENTATVMEDTLKDIEEFVDMREIISEWLAERVADGGGADDGYDDQDEFDDGGNTWKREEGDSRPRDAEDANRYSLNVSPLDLAGILYESLAFWLRIRGFLHALSRGSANAYAFRLRPRYERELMVLLLDLASTSSARADPRQAGRVAVDKVRSAAVATAPGEDGGAGAKEAATNEDHRSAKKESLVKEEPAAEDGDGSSPHALDTAAMVAAASAAAAAADDGNDGEDAEEQQEAVALAEGADDRRQHKRDVASALLADALALANCKGGNTTTAAASGGRSLVVSETLRARSKGIDPKFYAMVHARLGVMVSRDRLRQFSGSAAATAPPPLTVAQRNVLEQEEANQQAAAAAAANAMGGIGDAAAMGVPLDYVPDDQYFRRVLAQQHDTVGEDEEIYKEEVVDYYLKKQQQQQLQQSARGDADGKGRRANAGGGANRSQLNQPLVKPHRYCKVKTGYTWTQYNRTHYDSRTNPPPRTILWYEFTLFYPALVNSRRDMRNIFRIEDTPRGPSDDYCLLVFSVGPPYEDVAYRIVKKQWDTRRGGVRISFDATGKYKLFFRFTNSNYRR